MQIKPMPIYYGIKPAAGREQEKEAAFPETVWFWQNNPVFAAHKHYQKKRVATLEEYLRLSHFGQELLVSLQDGVYVLADYCERASGAEPSGYFYRKLEEGETIFAPQIENVKVEKLEARFDSEFDPRAYFTTKFTSGEAEFKAWIKWSRRENKWSISAQKEKVSVCPLCKNAVCKKGEVCSIFFANQFLASYLRAVLLSEGFQKAIQSKENKARVRMAAKGVFQSMREANERNFIR